MAEFTWTKLEGFSGQGLKMEPAIRIERTTCGLRSSATPTTDNLTPQETTHQDAPKWGLMGVSSSVLVTAW